MGEASNLRIDIAVVPICASVICKRRRHKALQFTSEDKAGLKKATARKFSHGSPSPAPSDDGISQRNETLLQSFQLLFFLAQAFVHKGFKADENVLKNQRVKNPSAEEVSLLPLLPPAEPFCLASSGVDGITTVADLGKLLYLSSALYETLGVCDHARSVDAARLANSLWLLPADDSL